MANGNGNGSFDPIAQYARLSERVENQGKDQRWPRLVRQFGGLAKVDRVGFYAANFSIISAVA
jgi:hypothetical protein